jgi:hypothetical protein
MASTIRRRGMRAGAPRQPPCSNRHGRGATGHRSGRLRRPRPRQCSSALTGHSPPRLSYIVPRQCGQLVVVLLRLLHPGCIPTPTCLSRHPNLAGIRWNAGPSGASCGWTTEGPGSASVRAVIGGPAPSYRWDDRATNSTPPARTLREAFPTLLVSRLGHVDPCCRRCRRLLREWR